VFFKIYFCRYDYLEFTDARGGKVRYDMKVGTEKWPKVQKLLLEHFNYNVLMLSECVNCVIYIQWYE